MKPKPLMSQRSSDTIKYGAVSQRPLWNRERAAILKRMLCPLWSLAETRLGKTVDELGLCIQKIAPIFSSRANNQKSMSWYLKCHFTPQLWQWEEWLKFKRLSVPTLNISTRLPSVSWLLTRDHNKEFVRAYVYDERFMYVMYTS